jgi:hypothetical protein
MDEDIYTGITEFGLDHDQQMFIEISGEKTIVINHEEEEQTYMEVFEQGNKIDEAKPLRTDPTKIFEGMMKKHK